MNKQEKPKWFKGVWYNEGDTVANPFSGDKCKLTGPELSMYDFIKGAEFTIAMQSNDMTILHPDTINLQNDMRKGLDWFRTNNASAYMTLLD
tara:strand:- start:39 stop:314 length:276 start_codon:yes stop_codon:yes gene_type:complete